EAGRALPGVASDPPPSHDSRAQAPTIPSGRAAPPPNRTENRHQQPKIRQVAGNPWLTYEGVMEIYQGRSVVLARHRSNKGELVNIQWLEQTSASKTVADTINHLSHHSFPRLLECYQQGDHAFLVWEPVELSVSQILASRCSITQSELVAIISAVRTDFLYALNRREANSRAGGIRHLRDRGRALATLDADKILLTDSGEVKIAGVEHCQISASEMDAATLKLVALAEIVRRLMKKNGPRFAWGAEAESLPQRLTTLTADSIDEFLR
ncbi:hypothetical protein NUU61_001442, partial [Penicillium alfredii]